jgi:hypothetical protein
MNRGSFGRVIRICGGARGEKGVSGARMGLLLMTLASLVMVASVCRAQKGSCDEKTVRRKSQQPLPEIASQDVYVNAQNSDRPLVGYDSLVQFRNQQLAGRRNNQPPRFEPERVVTSKNANMAYEYGKAHVEYDLAANGQHVSYDLDYLRVWKVEDKVCKVAAVFSRGQKLAGIK